MTPLDILTYNYQYAQPLRMQSECVLVASMKPELKKVILHLDASCKEKRTLSAIAWYESRGGRALKNSKSTASGAFQYLDSTWKRQCKGDKNSFKDQAECALKDLRKGRLKQL